MTERQPEYTLQLDLQQIIRDRLHVSEEAIAMFCQKWNIVEFALFGSVLRNDFRVDSDIDVLIVFALNQKWSLFDVMRMQQELEERFGRKVDLVKKSGLVNPYRRANILNTYQVIYSLVPRPCLGMPSGGSRLPLLQNNKVIDHTTLSATVSSGQSPVAEN
jgi:uncharacterized protein